MPAVENLNVVHWSGTRIASRFACPALSHECTPVQNTVPPGPRPIRIDAARLLPMGGFLAPLIGTEWTMVKIDRTLVVGGGIAGLTAAAALHRRGFTTELVERQPTWSAPGAGFMVHANGMRMLRALGLDAGVTRAGTVCRRWQFYDAQGC